MTLADGVFAIVLTLLVLDLRPPQAVSNRDLARQLQAMVPALTAFLVSFIVVGNFWFGHQMESHWIRRSDRVHVWITLLLLLTICFIPFSAALIGRNPRLPLATTIYGLNLGAAGLARWLHWSYATSGGRLVDHDIDPRLVRYVRKVFLAVVGLYVLAVAVGWFSTTVALGAFAVIPVAYMISARQSRHLTSLPRTA